MDYDKSIITANHLKEITSELREIYKRSDISAQVKGAYITAFKKES